MPPKSCPLHPGEVIRKKIAKWKRGAKVTYLAAIMGVSRSELSRVMNGRTSVKARFAIGLARAFHVSAEWWLRVQASYDLWHARRLRRARRRNGGGTLPFAATLRITGRIRVLA